MYNMTSAAVLWIIMTLMMMVVSSGASFAFVPPPFPRPIPTGKISSSNTLLYSLKPGQVLVASPTKLNDNDNDDNDNDWFDTASVAHPVVLPPCAATHHLWHLYYYGHDGFWACQTQPVIPTGCIGLATSTDGIHWNKVRGTHAKGAILVPSSTASDWDSLHVGVADVLVMDDGSLHMYYFGGGQHETPLQLLGQSTVGMRMHVGRAKSTDGGITWHKLGTVLDPCDEEGYFCAWPRILRPSSTTTTTTWTMIYHSYHGTHGWRVFGATSTDQGATWERANKVLLQGTPGAWDSKGIGTRSLIPWNIQQYDQANDTNNPDTDKKGWLMIYEAVDASLTHRLGAAYCAQSDGLGPWHKLHPTTPLLEPGVPPLEPWTNTVVGTPWIVACPLTDTTTTTTNTHQQPLTYRLYYVARGKAPEDLSMTIGMVEAAPGADILQGSSWKSVP
jgi:predicted GH43/DUF377 family glycosyl hydrolase